MAIKKLHDKLALKAAASGKTAEQFKEAAQKHANAAWFLLIMAAVVWYLIGFGAVLSKILVAIKAYALARQRI